MKKTKLNLLNIGLLSISVMAPSLPLLSYTKNEYVKKINHKWYYRSRSARYDDWIYLSKDNIKYFESKQELCAPIFSLLNIINKNKESKTYKTLTYDIFVQDSLNRLINTELYYKENPTKENELRYKVAGLNVARVLTILLSRDTGFEFDGEKFMDLVVDNLLNKKINYNDLAIPDESKNIIIKPRSTEDKIRTIEDIQDKLAEIHSWVVYETGTCEILDTAYGIFTGTILGLEAVLELTKWIIKLHKWIIEHKDYLKEDLNTFRKYTDGILGNNNIDYRKIIHNKRQRRFFDQVRRELGLDFGKFSEERPINIILGDSTIYYKGKLQTYYQIKSEYAKRSTEKGTIFLNNKQKNTLIDSFSSYPYASIVSKKNFSGSTNANIKDEINKINKKAKDLVEKIIDSTNLFYKESERNYDLNLLKKLHDDEFTNINNTTIAEYISNYVSILNTVNLRIFNNDKQQEDWLFKNIIDNRKWGYCNKWIYLSTFCRDSFVDYLKKTGLFYNNKITLYQDSYNKNLKILTSNGEKVLINWKGMDVFK